MSTEIKADELSTRMLELARCLLRAGKSMEQSDWHAVAKEAEHAVWLAHRLEHLQKERK